MLDFSTSQHASKCISGEGIVSEIVYPGKEWRVGFQASYWSARSNYPIAFEPGDFVRIVAIDLESIMLLIEPI